METQAVLHTKQAVIRREHAIQVKVPLPFPLRWVNAYLLRGGDGWTLIDPGLRTAAAEALWTQALAELGIGWRDIDRIVLTHHHPDHYGLAGWFQERTGAPVLLSGTGLEQVKLLWGEGEPMTARLLELFRRHGMPEEQLAPMREHMDSFVPLVSPQPEVTVIARGERIRLGAAEYEALEMPGHAAGHLCFYRREEEVVFCGDHVLPQISPNVSYLPGVDENPLASYLASLDSVRTLPVRMAYPGHREPFSRFGERAAELIRHHGERLETMLAMAASPKTAYDVCREAFGDKLSLHQLRFALSETIAHLIWLREAGRAAEETGADGATVLYRRR
ncbi:MBL fold metallo-hydrolase [Paenibacillus ginsengihumi]|uniref:MBL fold metallo-hydrolase n=1 Tax=Paenibacillus ginsengihumi TaxID=431596 RepID=UPI000594DEF2|nr:MBL fold metallo-hydrolase [Paenibacillus ginsengihumi]